MHQTLGGNTDDSNSAVVDPGDRDGADPSSSYAEEDVAGSRDTDIKSEASAGQGSAGESKNPSVNPEETRAQTPPEVVETPKFAAQEHKAIANDTSNASGDELAPAEHTEVADPNNVECDKAVAVETHAIEQVEHQVPDLTSDEQAIPTDAAPAAATAHVDSAQLQEFTETLNDVRRRVGELARLGERNADHVAALHTENQRLRNGDLRAALNPMVRDIIRVYDDVIRLASLDEEQPSHLGIVASLLIDTLSRWDVVAYTPEMGDDFDTTLHSGVVRIATSEPISNTIAGVRRCGFRMDGKVLRTADVEVYRQEPSTDSTESDQTTTAEVPT